MLINQSNQLLHYCQESPIRLLSLPSQQTEMVKKLKISKFTRNWDSPLHHSITKPTKVRSLRLQQQIEDVFAKPVSPQSKSIEISPTIHSMSRRNMPTWKQIYKKNRYSVLKHFMKQDSSLIKKKVNRDYIINQSQVSKLLRISNKPLFGEKNLPQIYRNQMRVHKKQKQLRNMMIFDRVNDSVKLNTVVRKLISSKNIPL